MDAKTLISSAKRRESTCRVCLAGDLAGEHEALEAQLEDLTKDGGWTAKSLADANPVTPLVERIEALQAEMQASTVTLKFRALRRHDLDTLLKEHEKADQSGYDIEALAIPLVSRSLLDPEMTEAEVGDLFEVLNVGQRDEMFGTAWSVNMEATSVPFSERASVVTRWREQNSKSPEATASPEASS
jgi:hypothetical protein